jgi:hypothetical protein
VSVSKNYPPFHLSVTADGLVSLWDEAEQARAVEDETYVRLELTDEQVQALDAAARWPKNRVLKQGELPKR